MYGSERCLRFILLIAVFLSVAAEWIIETASIAEDATTLVSQSVASVKFRNDGLDALDTVRLTFPCDDIDSNAPLVQEGESLQKPFVPLAVERTETVSTQHDSGKTFPCYKEFSVGLNRGVKAGDSMNLIILWASTKAVAPSPGKIQDNEPQYVQYRGSAYYLSPYRIVSMIKEVSVPRGDIAYSPSHPVPVSVEGNIVVFGDYNNLPPFSHEPVMLRFRNDNGFLVADKAIREIYLSHWGNMAVREEFYLSNVAATHVGSWSRIDYTKTNSHYPTAIPDVWAYLPREASDIVYKDLVGNVTTSHLREPNGKFRSLQLTFRFPLVGGWKYHFWYTYNVPLHNFARSHNSNHFVNIPIFPSIHKRFLLRELVVRVILPEGASEVRIKPHKTVRFQTQESFQKTTLNYYGRKVVTLTAENVYSRAAVHARQIGISYNLSSASLLVTPCLIVGGIFGIFIAYLVFANSSLVLVPEAADEDAQARLLASEQIARISAECEKMDDLYRELDGLLESCSSKDSLVDTMNSRMRIETELRSHENEVSDAVMQLKQLQNNKAELAGAILQRYITKRDGCMRYFSSWKMHLQGDMGQDVFKSQVERKLSHVIGTVSEELVVLVDSLTDYL